MVPTPTAFGLTLCEKIIVEEGSRRITLINSFTKLLEKREVHVFLRISDLVFPIPGQYQLILLVDGEWVAHRRLRVRSSGRLIMSSTNPDSPQPNGACNDNLDPIIIVIDEPGDSTIRPLRPEIRRLLDEDGNIRVRPVVPERKPPSEAPPTAP